MAAPSLNYRIGPRSSCSVNVSAIALCDGRQLGKLVIVAIRLNKGDHADIEVLRKKSEQMKRFETMIAMFQVVHGTWAESKKRLNRYQ